MTYDPAKRAAHEALDREGVPRKVGTLSLSLSERRTLLLGTRHYIITR